MHTNVMLTNKRCTHAQSNYTNTKLKAWFRHFLCRPARKRSGPILHPWTHMEDNRDPHCEMTSTDLGRKASLPAVCES